jgi:uncharacterized membrane protein
MGIRLPLKDAIELQVNCPIGSKVYWETILGKQYVGTLIEWDSNVAIVKLENSKTKAVEC